VHQFTLSILASTIFASAIESETTDTTFGDDVTGSPRNLIAATIVAATSRAPSSGWRCTFLRHAGFLVGTTLHVLCRITIG
jgi:hypothetical protein